MARFKYQMTEAKLARFVREGRGRGEGVNYKPWLTIQDVPSKGRSHRVACQKTGGRTMHFLSDHEYVAFLELWWDETVTDIREQYPLDLIRTLEIASQLGVRHPIESATGTILTQTTDLLFTRSTSGQDVLVAWSVKDKGALTNSRTAEKLEIERQYWMGQGVEWRLVINNGLNSFFALNLAWLFEFENAVRMNAIQINVGCIENLLNAIEMQTDEVIGDLCALLDKRNSNPPGSHISALRHLLLSRAVEANLDEGKLSRQALSNFWLKP